MPLSVDVLKCGQLPSALDATGRLKVTQADAAYSNTAIAGLTWATDVSLSPLAMSGCDNISFSVELDNASGTAAAAKVTAEVSVDGGTTYYAFADFGSTEVSISGADSYVIRGSLQGIPGADIQDKKKHGRPFFYLKERNNKTKLADRKLLFFVSWKCWISASGI